MNKRQATYILKNTAFLSTGTTASEIYSAIDMAVAALELSERKIGNWTEEWDDSAPIFLRRRFRCSACGKAQSYGMTKFCPNCGAEARW